MRKTFTLSDEDCESIMEASQSVAYMIFNGREPPTPQMNANRAWIMLGAKHGFKPFTVAPVSGRPKDFTAETLDAPLDPDAH